MACHTIPDTTIVCVVAFRRPLAILKTGKSDGGIAMKKSRLILAAALCLALAGCGSESAESSSYDIAEAGTWTDGVYTQTAEGKNGDFEVTVTIEEGSIASVEIGDNDETEDKGGVAIEELPDEIVEAQSYDVDTVSGATVTSEAIEDAVARCLEEASE